MPAVEEPEDIVQEDTAETTEIEAAEIAVTTEGDVGALPEVVVEIGDVVSSIGEFFQLTFDASDNGLGSYHPDGEKILFQSNRDGRWQIYQLVTLGGIVPLNANTEQHLIESDADDENPVWTLDGDRFLFVSNRDRDTTINEEWQRDIYIYNIEDASITRLTDDPADDWFPVPLDEESFLFLSERDVNPRIPVHARRNSLYRGFFDARPPVKITGPDIDPSCPLELDEGMLILRNSRGRLTSFLPDEQSVDPLTPSWLHCGTASINRLNQWLTMSAREENKYQLYLFGLESNTLQHLNTGDGEVRYPQFSPDGGAILFSADVDNYFQLFRIEIIP